MYSYNIFSDFYMNCYIISRLFRNNSKEAALKNLILLSVLYLCFSKLCLNCILVVSELCISFVRILSGIYEIVCSSVLFIRF